MDWLDLLQTEVLGNPPPICSTLRNPQGHGLFCNVLCVSFWNSKARSQSCLVAGDKGGISLAGTGFCLTREVRQWDQSQQRRNWTLSSWRRCYLGAPSGRSPKSKLPAKHLMVLCMHACSAASAIHPSVVHHPCFSYRHFHDHPEG